MRGERVHAAPPARESFLAGDEPRCEEESWALLAAGRLGFVAAGCRRLLPAAQETRRSHHFRQNSVKGKKSYGAPNVG